MSTDSEMKSVISRLDSSNVTAGTGNTEIMSAALSELEQIIKTILTAGDSPYNVRHLLSLNKINKNPVFLEAAAAILEFQYESRLAILADQESLHIANSFLPAAKAKNPIKTTAASTSKGGSASTLFIRENNLIPPALRLTGIAVNVFRQTNSHDFAKSSVNRLITAIELIPRHKKTGLLTSSEENPDQETANYLFRPSLFFAQACQQIADILHELYREGEADHWHYQAQQVEKYIRIYFWNKRMAMFRVCREAPPDLVDVHGSALAIYRKNATSGQLMSIARQFYKNYHILTDKGAILKYLNGQASGNQSAVSGEGNEKFDLTAAGWFAYSLDFINPRLADEIVSLAARKIAAKLNKHSSDTNASVRKDLLPVLTDIVAACRLAAAVYNMRERRRIKAARMA